MSAAEKENLQKKIAELADRIKESKAKLLHSAKIATNQPPALPPKPVAPQAAEVKVPEVKTPEVVPKTEVVIPKIAEASIPIERKVEQPKPAEPNFGLNYDLIAEAAKLPCDKWPLCTHGSECRKQHPSAAELSKPSGPVTLEDILPLVLPFKNSTVALEKLRHMVNNRAFYRNRFNEVLERGLASNIPIEKSRELAEKVVEAQLKSGTPIPSAVTQDQVLQAMGLVDSLHVVSGLAQSTKVTSERAWSAEHTCYFAVMRLDKAFLVRHYQLTSRPPVNPVNEVVDKDQDFTIVIENKERRDVHQQVLPKSVVHEKEGLSIVMEPKRRRIKEPDPPPEFLATSGMKTLNGVPLQKENKGFAMLEKMGWQSGTGLGKRNHGQQQPIAVPFFVGRAGLTGECDEHTDSSYLDSGMPAQVELISPHYACSASFTSSSSSSSFSASSSVSSSASSTSRVTEKKTTNSSLSSSCPSTKFVSSSSSSSSSISSSSISSIDSSLLSSSTLTSLLEGLSSELSSSATSLLPVLSSTETTEPARTATTTAPPISKKRSHPSAASSSSSSSATSSSSSSSSSDDFKLFMKENAAEPATVKDFDLYGGLD